MLYLKKNKYFTNKKNIFINKSGNNSRYNKF